MQIFRNRALAALREGRISLGFGVYHLRGSAVPLIANAAGYDWLFIDSEHGSFSIHEASQISLAALSVGVTPIVRVPFGAIDEAARALDNGAAGIIVPHVDTAAQARDIAQALRFPPRGNRSWGGAPVLLNYGDHPLGEAMDAIDSETLVCVMLETQEAVANAAEIAAVPGIDVLLFGTYDLTAEMGIPGQVGDPRVQMAYANVADACRKNGKYMGMGPLGSAEWEARYVQVGARFVLAAGDHGLIMQAASEKARNFRRLEAEFGGAER